MINLFYEILTICVENALFKSDFKGGFVCLLSILDGLTIYIIVWPYGTTGSMIPCIHMLFQPIFATIFLIWLPLYHRTDLHVYISVLAFIKLLSMIYVLVLQNSSIIQFSGWLLFGVREKTDVQTFYVLQVLSVKLLHLTTLQLSHFRVIGGSIQPKRSRKKENMQYKLYASMYKNGMQVKQEYLCTE